MNEVYNMIMNGSTDPFEKIIMIVLYLIMFEGIMTLIAQLISMGGKR
jgi:hypothetical protein